jgi:hypothetical protein
VHSVCMRSITSQGLRGRNKQLIGLPSTQSLAKEKSTRALVPQPFNPSPSPTLSCTQGHPVFLGMRSKRRTRAKTATTPLSVRS